MFENAIVSNAIVSNADLLFLQFPSKNVRQVREGHFACLSSYVFPCNLLLKEMTSEGRRAWHS